MREGEVAELAAKGESDRLEFKQSVRQLKEACQAVCAMLNTRGGHVLVGVKNNGTLLGDDVTDNTQSDIADALGKIQPAHLVTVELVALGNGKSVVVLVVPPGTGDVRAFEGRAYRRIGATNQVMTPGQAMALQSQRQDPAQRWEAQPAVGFGLGDLDDAEIVRTVDEMVRRGRGSDPGTRNAEDLLLGLNVLVGTTPSNAAVVLFAREGASFGLSYPQCRLKLARFRGVTEAEFEDNRQFSGNLFRLLLQAQDFLRQHLPIAGRVIPGVIERADEPIYPPEATREALANAFCHPLSANIR
ncbi:MAG TPA: RNA-binding domain-containing protein [Longimicrobiales bacterium]|nr:RNA-binding domain-containing protein [Longimicrobiales bacterium]